MTASKRKTKGATKRRQPLPLGKWMTAVLKMSFLVTIAGAAFFVAKMMAQISWQPLAVESAQVTDVLIYQDAEDVNQLLETFVGSSLITLDLSQVKSQLEQLDWIVKARVEKRWPGELMVSLEEHQPVAFWNGDKVLNSEGIALAKPVAEMLLPNLVGPEGKAADVMKQYLQFNRVFNEQNFRLMTVTMHLRGAWTLEMENGMVVSLGENHVIERSRRVMRVLSSAEYADMKIDYVDARYPNGVAIRLQEEKDAEGLNDIAA